MTGRKAASRRASDSPDSMSCLSVVKVRPIIRVRLRLRLRAWRANRRIDRVIGKAARRAMDRRIDRAVIEGDDDRA